MAAEAFGPLCPSHTFGPLHQRRREVCEHLQAAQGELVPVLTFLRLLLSGWPTKGSPWQGRWLGMIRGFLRAGEEEKCFRQVLPKRGQCFVNEEAAGAVWRLQAC